MVNECRFFFLGEGEDFDTVYDIIGKSFHRNQRVRFWWLDHGIPPKMDDLDCVKEFSFRCGFFSGVVSVVLVRDLFTQLF